MQPSQKDYPSLKFIFPAKFRKQAMRGYHDAVDHLRIEYSVDLLRDRFSGQGLVQL